MKIDLGILNTQEHRGADSGSRTRDKRLETSYVTTTPYPHDVMFMPRSLSSLSESVVHSQIKFEVEEEGVLDHSYRGQG